MNQREKGVSEPAATSQGSAGAVSLTKDERLRLRLVAGAIVVALALVVVVLRFHRLSELPPGLAEDEGLDGVLALKVLQGEHAVFFPVSNGREASAIYALALTTLVLGRTLLAMHLPTALGSTGLIFVVFWLGRLLFGRTESGRATPWQGLCIGAIGAGLLAVSLSQTVLGRTSYNKVTHFPLLLCLCLALLWSGWSQRSWWRVALAGFCAGLLPYTYIPARFTPFLFLLFGLSFLLPFGRVTRERVRCELPWAGVFVGVTGLVAAPILVHFALHPDHFIMRSSELSFFNSSHRLEGLGILLVNAWEHLLSFGIRGDPNWRHNFPGRPMLNLVEAFFFWLGVGLAARRWQRPAWRLLLLWLGVMLLPAILSRDGTVPHFLRMNGAAPAIYLLIGAGMWEAFDFLKARYFRENKTRSAIAVGSLACGLILVQGVLTYQSYFQKWGGAHEAFEAHASEWTVLAQALSAQPSDADTVYLIPAFQYQHNSFKYLYKGMAPTHIILMAAPNLAQEVQSTLAAVENVSAVKVVAWNSVNRQIGDDIGRFDFLLTKYGRREGSKEYGDFRLYNYTDISLRRPWSFVEYLEPLTVHYDGGIVLDGLALGQDEDQLDSQQLHLGRERSLWGVMQWQIAPGLNTDYAISLRLQNAEGERAHQEDYVLWNPSHHPTSHWPEDEPVDTPFLLDIPDDLAAGDYELRLVVYNLETLVPTVEIGVWEPEVTLARLHLAEIE